MALLGHIASADGITMDPAKVEAITKWPRPTAVIEIRSFLGLAGYYRRFVEGFSLLGLPFTKLMRKGEKYQIYSDALKKGLGLCSYATRCWLELLKDYDVNIQYHPCKANVVADAFSRKNFGILACLKIQPKIIKDLELMKFELVVRGSEGYVASLKIEPNLILQIKEAQKDEGELWVVIQKLKERKQAEFWVNDHGVIWYGNRLCVLDDSFLREVVLTEAHSSPFSIHPSSNKMYRDLKQNFWWNGMKHDVARFVAKCLTCQQVNIEHQRASGLLQPLGISTWKWDQISMDFVTRLPRTFKKNDAIWVVVDRLTKSTHFLLIQQRPRSEISTRSRRDLTEINCPGWWRAYKQAKGGDAYVATLSWNDFRDIFFLQYFPYSEKEKCEREYKSIRQLPEETSTDFMKRFLRLTSFLGAKAGTQEEQAKHFKWGLNDFVLDRILNTEFTDVAQVANAARKQQEG
ncbi:retrotransposon protein, putative, ty3-gypsy subclass [Tanacetum coccineum]